MSIGKDKAEKWNSCIYFCLLEVIINKSYVRNNSTNNGARLAKSGCCTNLRLHRSMTLMNCYVFSTNHK